MPTFIPIVILYGLTNERITTIILFSHKFSIYIQEKMIKSSRNCKGSMFSSLYYYTLLCSNGPQRTKIYKSGPTTN